jgi:hypothetical protein
VFLAVLDEHCAQRADAYAALILADEKVDATFRRIAPHVRCLPARARERRPAPVPGSGAHEPRVDIEVVEEIEREPGPRRS